MIEKDTTPASAPRRPADDGEGQARTGASMNRYNSEQATKEGGT